MLQKHSKGGTFECLFESSTFVYMLCGTLEKLYCVARWPFLYQKCWVKSCHILDQCSKCVTMAVDIIHGYLIVSFLLYHQKAVRMKVSYTACPYSFEQFN